MSTTYARIELLRTVRNIPNVFFIALLPGIFYLVFGAMQDYGSETAGNGNVAAVIMTSMAAYGAAVATMTIGGSVAVEQFQGWGRQLALTPMSTQGFIATKAVVAMAIALLPIGIVYATGALTGAEATLRTWLLSAAAIWAGSVVFALFGLAVGFAFRTEAALSAAGGALVILAFLGNVFIPLSGTMLAIGKLTPMYGMVALARYPQTEGIYTTSAGEPLWIPIANIIAWTIILGTAAALLSRRGRQRQ